jgi:hypothetical protein
MARVVKKQRGIFEHPKGMCRLIKTQPSLDGTGYFFLAVVLRRQVDDPEKKKAQQKLANEPSPIRRRIPKMPPLFQDSVFHPTCLTRCHKSMGLEHIASPKQTIAVCFLDGSTGKPARLSVGRL